MEDDVQPEDQLVLEAYARDIGSSVRFHVALGFEVERDDGNFVVLHWGRSKLHLESMPEAPQPPASPVGNVRIMVSDVDERWAAARRLGARVIKPIGDRYYGLRDFTIAGPDGIGLRFAARLKDG